MMTEKQTSEHMERGFVYLFKDVNYSDHYKIGISRDVKRRARQVGYVTIIHIIPVDNMALAEQELHSIFSNQRLDGEWFRLYEPNIEYIQSITKYRAGVFLLSDRHPLIAPKPDIAQKLTVNQILRLVV